MPKLNRFNFIVTSITIVLLSISVAYTVIQLTDQKRLGKEDSYEFPGRISVIAATEAKKPSGNVIDGVSVKHKDRVLTFGHGPPTIWVYNKRSGMWTRSIAQSTAAPGTFVQVVDGLENVHKTFVVGQYEIVTLREFVGVDTPKTV